MGTDVMVPIRGHDTDREWDHNSEEGGRDITSKQQLVHSNDISKARIVDTSHKDHSMVSSKLKSSDYCQNWLV